MNAPLATMLGSRLDPETVSAETVAQVFVGNSSYDEIWRDRDVLEAELDPFQLIIDMADDDEIRDEVLCAIVSTNKMPLARKWLLDRCRIVAEDSGKWLARQRKERRDEAQVEARDERNR